MLNIIEGGFLSGAHEFILDKIKKLTECKKRSFLIVPEQQTVVREAEMTALLPEYAPLVFEVTNFTRLADTVFRTVGGIDGEHLDRIRRSLVMWSVLTNLSEAGEINVGKEISAGLVDKMLSALADMDSAGICSGELTSAVDSLGASERRLTSKVKELGKIMDEYKKRTEERYVGGANDIAAMHKLLSANPHIFRDAKFFIEGFTSFTESQYKVLFHLATVTEVYVHLVIPKSMRDAFEYTETVDTEKRLIDLTRVCGNNVTRLDGCFGNAYVGEYLKKVWRTGESIDKDKFPYRSEIEVVEAKNPFDECNFIAEDIRRRVALGSRFCDVAVIARHADAYDGIIDRALIKAKIPFFYSRVRDAESFKPIKLIHSAYASILYGYRTEDVIAYSKCAPGDLCRDECDELELYVKAWQISGRKLTSPEPFTLNPDGYTERKSRDMQERLDALTKTKDKLITPLLTLQGKMRKALTVRDHATALVEFLKEIKLEAAIDDEARALFGRGEAAAAEDYQGLWDAICRALDVLVSTSGDDKCTSDSFYAQLKIALSGASIGKIPSFRDSVVIGNADSIHLPNKKHVYILGLNRGEFPETITDSAYFSDKDKLTLSRAGLNVTADRDIRGAKELYTFLRAASYAKEKLTLLYTKKSAGGADTPRSDVITKTLSAITVNGKPLTVKSTLDIPVEERIFTPEAGIETLGNLTAEKKLALTDALGEMGLGDKLSVSRGRITNDLLDASASQNAGGKPLALTQSIIDDYNNCPLLHFLKHKLHLNPERNAEFDSRNIGTFIHAVIEGFFKKVTDGGVSFRDLDDNAVESLTRDCAKEYIDTLGNNERSKQEEFLLERLCNASLPVIKNLRDEFSISSFKPRYFELKIAEGNDTLPEPARFTDSDGDEVYVYGTIDRVDTCKIGDEVYVRVVDYKTGTKDFSPSDIEKEKNLQMFLYLKSITDTKNEHFLRSLEVEKGHTPLPAGVIYVKTEIGDVSVKSSNEAEVKEALSNAQKRMGMILASKEIIAATGEGYSPVKLTTKGEIYKKDSDKAYTPERWEEITKTISERVTDVAKGIKHGRINATPSGEDACKYCDFKALCRSAK